MKMDQEMKNKIAQINRRFSTVEAKISFLKEGVDELGNAFRDLNDEFNGFIDLYVQQQEKVDERLNRIEKHIGLD
ncbi:MAG: hypothetical protein ACLFUB_15235 [Cyclobacteriaceae bacterium]